MAANTITVSYPEPDIAVLTLDMPDKGANVLSRSVLEELSAHLDSLETNNELAGLIFISGKPGQFIAGADLREFAASLDIESKETVEMCLRGQGLFQRFTKCPFVTIAAIDGICVGGGAELASWCDRRVMTSNPKTQFGFPEVKLGLFPGWGGTVRGPRLVGLSNAVEMITGGESISGKEAFQMGWACDLVDAEDLLGAAIRVVRAEQETGEYKQDRETWSGSVDISAGELGFLGAAASAMIQKHTKGQYPAPVSALEIMLGAAGVDSDTACQMEAEGMADLFGSPINRSLLNIFFLTDRNKKDTGVANQSVEPADIKSAGVIGAGIMGAGIAAANVRRRISATITDTRPEALAQGVQSILEEVSYNRELKAKDVEKAVEFAPLVNGTLSSSEVAKADVVIEAAVENKDIKKQIFAGLEPHMRDDAILASNTSTIPISDLASELQRPERFCGIHFFNPVRKMKLVEVIRGQKTSDETVATAVAYVKRLGKMPIICNDGPGFLVNRLLLPYMNEALELVLEGAEVKTVEKSAKTFGMPMGPIELYDMVGIDTAVHAGKVLCDAFPDRFSGNELLPALLEAGRLGRKTGTGFYSYNNKKKKPQPDPDFDKFLKTYQTSQPKKFDRKELTNRLFLPMLVEATRILEEEIVRDPRDIDLGMIFGTGFPPFKGGLMFWADSVGADKIVEMLKPFESLGKRFHPTDLLLEKAKSGGKFYG
jgi:3-hydroxyacyl-CoA dehydrogenase/enoyl-CoA hydratase/3-hydroxybutyryl-CoA epimerase/3-hydroxyacyl-CoA dehydrogenase/enoyl-CoA hydratase/3-hydroxybutyryl-CoA epimerase/enoyl-CoA isomerase